MNRLDAMAAFVRVAELASFTKAAVSLGWPKSRVSMAVLQLEAHLKTQLLYRTTRKVQLTHDGQAFYERSRDVLADIEDIDTMFQQTPGSLTGGLRVDMPIAIAQNLVIPRLPEFLDRHPAVTIELSSTDRRVDVIAEGFDCVVRVGQLPDSALMVRNLGLLHMVNVAAPAYLARFGTPETPAGLDGHHLVHYVSAMGARPFGFEYRQGDAYVTRDVEGRVFVNNTLAFNSAVRAGLGIIQCPLTGVAQALRDGELIEIMKDYTAEPMPVSLIYPRRRHQARRVRVFMEWIAGLMAGYLV